MARSRVLSRAPLRLPAFRSASRTSGTMMWQKARSMFSDRPEVPEMSEHAHKVWKRAIRKYRLERYKQAVHHATMASHAPRKRLARSKSLDRMSVHCVNAGIDLEDVVAHVESIELQVRAARASLSRAVQSRRRRPSALADAARPPAAVPPPPPRVPPPPSLRIFAVLARTFAPRFFDASRARARRERSRRRSSAACSSRWARRSSSATTRPS